MPAVTLSESRAFVPVPPPSAQPIVAKIGTQNGSEKASIVVSIDPLVTNVAVPLRAGVTLNARSGWPLVLPQESGV